MADTALAAIARRLRRAQPDWAATSVTARAEVLRALASRLEKKRPELVRALAADTGRTRLSDAEVTDSIALIHFWANQMPALLADSQGTRFQPSAMAKDLQWATQLVPCPLVGFITPWNFPLTMALIDAIPALAAGCSAILKPSEHTPRFIQPLAETIAGVSELQSVCALIEGGAEAGAELVDTVDHICFTGSVETGRSVAIAAAQRLIPATLELGGKDPAIVTPSADLARTAEAILAGATANSGQSCLAIERVYVVGEAYRPFLAQLVKRAKAIPQDDQPPLHLAKQARNLARQLAQACAQGANILYGGPPASDDWQNWPPTIVADATHDMALMQEESFGPVLPVMQAASAEEAIALANDSHYGLSAAVFAGSEEEALQIARQLQAGAVSINACGLTTVTAEPVRHAFGVSGLGGSRSGPEALYRFLRHKALITRP